uniref:RING-CH-type domain-containing protein n=1 Tax=Chloropicon laureae TaxID=464258 RepID=A0A7S2Z547_9CHLO|mmetsp:Transcript_5615/g.14523  ORF Transcript_5615/g.14523 Transcript_5615/m.14523 type:complete len:249 (+) Transcript_5615:3-749(+)
MAFLHKSCLDKWITESKTLECEICKQPFNLPDSEVEEWQALFEQTTASRHALSIGVQAEQEEVPAFEGIENRRLRSCLQRTWRNRGAMNSSIIVLIGTSVLVMMSLVLYHFLSPSGERVIAGALPPGQSLYEPFNCTMHQGGSGEEQRDMDAVGWLCGVPATQIYQGDCVGRDDDEPCGEWNKFTLLQSSIPRCFFGHGSICYVALQPDPKLGGICREGACIPFESSKQGRKKMENGMLAQGRCVACQ